VDAKLPDSDFKLPLRSHAPSNNPHEAAIVIVLVHRIIELDARIARIAWTVCFRTRRVAARSMPDRAGSESERVG